MTRTFVVTCSVPSTDFAELDLKIVDHTVRVTGPDGFREDLEVPQDADLDRLEVELHKHFLEIRAPLK